MLVLQCFFLLLEIVFKNRFVYIKAIQTKEIQRCETIRAQLLRILVKIPFPLSQVKHQRLLICLKSFQGLNGACELFGSAHMCLCVFSQHRL